jgi:hypothetical protein
MQFRTQTPSLNRGRLDLVPPRMQTRRRTGGFAGFVRLPSQPPCVRGVPLPVTFPHRLAPALHDDVRRFD